MFISDSCDGGMVIGLVFSVPLTILFGMRVTHVVNGGCRCAFVFCLVFSAGGGRMWCGMEMYGSGLRSLEWTSCMRI